MFLENKKSYHAVLTSCFLILFNVYLISDSQGFYVTADSFKFYNIFNANIFVFYSDALSFCEEKGSKFTYPEVSKLSKLLHCFLIIKCMMIFRYLAIWYVTNDVLIFF